MSYKDIRAALESRLDTLSIELAWQNVDFSPTTGTAYIESRFIPTNRRPAVAGTNPQHRIEGLFQLLLHHPEGVGSGDSSDTLDEVIELFDSTTDISYTNADTETIIVGIENAEARGSYSKSPWFVTPVNIAWYIYK